MMQEIVRLHLTRYDLPSEAEAVALAHKDLVEAEDYLHAPPQDTPCKMRATDVLRQAAVGAPGLINEAILQDCIRVFPKCNAASQINIVRIIGHLQRRDFIPFLEKVRDDQTRRNAVSVSVIDNKPVARQSRAEGFPDMVAEEATAVLSQLRG